MAEATIEELAERLARHRRGVTAKVNDNDRLQANDLLEAYLIIPHADVLGTEYAVGNVEGSDSIWPGGNREEAIEDAMDIRRNQTASGRVPDAQPLQRPNLAYTPIPLPVDDNDGRNVKE